MSFDEEIDNPYNPNSQDYGGDTPPLDVIIRDAMTAASQKLNVWLPAQVVNIRGNQKVDIQLMLKRKYTNGQLVTLPPIQNVMVGMPMGQNYSIKLPIDVGDTGMALFCDRSLDVWSVQGGVVDPGDIRQHDLSDPVFIPGLVPFSGQTQDSTTDMVLKNGSAELHLQRAGTFLIKNTSNELLDLLDQLLDLLANNTFTNTELGPQPFIAGTVTVINQIKTKLDTLKGS